MFARQIFCQKNTAVLIATTIVALITILSLAACAASEASIPPTPTATAGPTYSASEGVRQIVQAEPNVPTDNREPWLGSEAWIEAVQAGQLYVTQHPQPVNVQILTDMTTSEIWEYMQQHVSGALGVSCQYCHDINNYAADPYPEKISARLMLVMMRDLNAQYITQVPQWAGNYVQCATCHRNEPINMYAFSNERGTLPFDAYAVDSDYDYVANHVKTGKMLAMVEWMENNWNRFVLPRREPIDPAHLDLRERYNLLTFDDTLYSAPNCYTCHAGNRIPNAAISQEHLRGFPNNGKAILPPLLRGTPTP